MLGQDVVDAVVGQGKFVGPGLGRSCASCARGIGTSLSGIGVELEAAGRVGQAIKIVVLERLVGRAAVLAGGGHGDAVGKVLDIADVVVGVKEVLDAVLDRQGGVEVSNARWRKAAFGTR